MLRVEFEVSLDLHGSLSHALRLIFDSLGEAASRWADDTQM